jgi:hypothetical protein
VGGWGDLLWHDDSSRHWACAERDVVVTLIHKLLRVEVGRASTVRKS